ncbi:MAG: TatD family hydrolase [Spirochaetaceae bacterium]|nr:TatD family hydrolase [Spirochaetaceae bacterium]
MAHDAHAHPRDLLRRFPGAEAERRRLGIACAASAWNGEEYDCHEKIAAEAERDGAPPLFLCFAVHPQLAGTNAKVLRPADPGCGESTRTGFAGCEPGGAGPAGDWAFRESLDLLERLSAEGRIAAVGETGFDLYDEHFRAAETVQEKLFAAHLDNARRHNLPLVLHVRRAMHKIFACTKSLKTLPAVVFHSWPGAPDEGFSLLRRGINAYFSFGTTLLLNHKNALRSCAAFPAERLLLETDAPYQPLRGAAFSRWGDLPAILRAAAAIRREAGQRGGEPAELEQITDGAFMHIFKGARP